MDHVDVDKIQHRWEHMKKDHGFYQPGSIQYYQPLDWTHHQFLHEQSDLDHEHGDDE